MPKESLSAHSDHESKQVFNMSTVFKKFTADKVLSPMHVSNYGSYMYSTKTGLYIYSVVISSAVVCFCWAHTMSWFLKSCTFIILFNSQEAGIIFPTLQIRKQSSKRSTNLFKVK